MKRYSGIVALLLGVAGVLAFASVVVADGPPLLTEYPVPGGPLYVSVEAPGRIWFTLPDQNWIGRLIVTSTVDYSVVTYTIPTLNSRPYDLKYASDAVWFTEFSGNKIGRLNPADGAVTEFSIPTQGSQPTGIDVLAGNPTTVWFTERSGNKLGRLVVTGTADYSFTEFPLPESYPNAEPEDLHIQHADSIWFTAPGVNRIGNLKPSQWPSTNAFVFVSTGGGSRPWAIKVDAEGYPWFTERVGNRIGQFFPQTIANINWYTLTLTPSGPYDLAVGAGYVWFTEADGNRVGQLRAQPRMIRQFGLPANSQPRGLAVDANGCAWIALSGRNSIAAWCPPYFRFVYLPLTLKNFGP